MERREVDHAELVLILSSMPCTSYVQQGLMEIWVLPTHTDTFYSKIIYSNSTDNWYICQGNHSNVINSQLRPYEVERLAQIYIKNGKRRPNVAPILPPGSGDNRDGGGN